MVQISQFSELNFLTNKLLLYYVTILVLHILSNQREVYHMGEVFSRRILQLLITCITHDYTLLCTSLKLRIQNDVLLCLVRSQLTLLRGCLSGSPDRASDTHGQIALGIHHGAKHLLEIMYSLPTISP
jgi:hypothetical protein